MRVGSQRTIVPDPAQRRSSAWPRSEERPVESKLIFALSWDGIRLDDSTVCTCPPRLLQHPQAVPGFSDNNIVIPGWIADLCASEVSRNRSRLAITIRV